MWPPAAYMKSVYYYVIPAIFVFVLAAFGIYQLYKSRVDNSVIMPSPTATPVGFFASPSPNINTNSSPVLGTNANTPNSQPEAGFDTQEIKNVGIFVDRPLEGNIIDSPVTVTGKANVFEGNIQIRVLDDYGKILARGSATACMDVDACPFEASVSFPQPSTAKGKIEVFSPSPIGDQAEDYKQIISVLFK